MIIEWVWRALILLLGTFFFRLCSITIVVLLMVRAAGCKDIWDLERYAENSRKLTKEEYRAKVRAVTPFWFRLIFLWRL
jgi:hypothetical protein